MKYQSLTAFEKHITQAAPDHFASIYLIALSDDYERHTLIKRLAKELGSLESLNAGETPVPELIGRLNTLDLFGDRAVISFDQIDKLKTSEVNQLLPYAAQPARSKVLILGAASLKSLKTLCQQLMREAVILDLCGEKPWERKKRMESTLFALAHQRGKQIGRDVAEYLLTQVGLDYAALENELVKLITFVGDKKELVLSDAQKICCALPESTTWQLSEKLIWQQQLVPPPMPFESQHLFPLIGQLRYQLELGEQIKQHLIHGENNVRIAARFPNLRPQMIEKYVGFAARLSSDHFRKGLKALHLVERQAKNGQRSALLLWEIFAAQMI